MRNFSKDGRKSQASHPRAAARINPVLMYVMLLQVQEKLDLNGRSQINGRTKSRFQNDTEPST